MTIAEGLERAKSIADGSLKPEYSPWRHGGWYVDNLHYPSGAVGCVARYNNGKEWRIACDERRDVPIFRSRDEAARAEAVLVMQEWAERATRVMVSQ